MKQAKAEKTAPISFDDEDCEGVYPLDDAFGSDTIGRELHYSSNSYYQWEFDICLVLRCVCEDGH